MRKIAVIFAFVVGCGGGPPPRTPQQRADDSAAAVTALAGAEFTSAQNAAGQALALDPHNARAAAVRAIARYQDAASSLFTDLQLLLEGGNVAKAFDHEEGRAMWQKFAAALADVDRDLAIVAADPSFSLELCLACWEHDWNRNGRIDDGDRKLFQIEYDPHCPPDSAPVEAPPPPDPGPVEAPPPPADGTPMPPPEVPAAPPPCTDEIPEGDPRRKPTFRFDVGDADWARAMIAFQRAAVELILAYRWNELDKLFSGSSKQLVVTLKLADASRAQRARELIRAGLAYSERSRTEYLAETDDDREWVPNPRQKSHPIPLPMDAGVYATWQGAVGDLANLVDGTDAISLRAAAGLVDRKLALFMPDAWIDVGAMLRDPKDVVIDFGIDDNFRESDPVGMRGRIEAFLRGMLGNGYHPTADGLRPSPIIERIEKLKQQMEHDPNESFDRKLRYLLWIN